MVKRIGLDRSVGVIIDVQDFFLSQIGSRPARTRMETNTGHFALLLGYFRIPLIATLERPVRAKGLLPAHIRKQVEEKGRLFEKDFFDLSKEKKIRDHLAGLKKQQVIVAGCETDVCVLQSCLGLMDLGYEVFVVEDLLFSSARNVDSAIHRMQAEGAVFLTYKTLFYELVEAVDGGRHAERMRTAFGPFPDDLPDQIVGR